MTYRSWPLTSGMRSMKRWPEIWTKCWHCSSSKTPITPKTGGTNSKKPLTTSLTRCFPSWRSSSRLRCSTLPTTTRASAPFASQMWREGSEAPALCVRWRAVSTSMSSLRSTVWRTSWSNYARSSTSTNATPKKATWTVASRQEVTWTSKWSSLTKISSFNQWLPICRW